MCQGCWVEIIHYSPKEIDFGKKNAFPFRDQHFFASIEKARRELDWEPELDLISGLADSYNLDFGRGTFRNAAAFTTDDMILGGSLVLQNWIAIEPSGRWNAAVLLDFIKGEANAVSFMLASLFIG